MTTKDYVYLGLLALAAVVFYCHGFYAGISRSARIYDALLKDDEAIDSPIIDTGDDEALPTPTPPRHSFPSSPSFPLSFRRELRGDFGNN